MDFENHSSDLQNRVKCHFLKEADRFFGGGRANLHFQRPRVELITTYCAGNRSGGFRDDLRFGLISKPDCLPDHLANPGTYAGSPCDQEDAELKLERGWLASSLQCFLDDGCESNAPKKETQYRLPA